MNPLIKGFSIIPFQSIQNSERLDFAESWSIGRMKRFYRRSKSLKRLFATAFGRRCAEENESNQEVKKPTWRCFSYEEIHGATKGFNQDNLVGRGGYAEVYRGELVDGQMIAVKRLTGRITDEQKEKEFLTELGTVGHVSHPNVTAFLGCCIDQELHLIFEFSSLDANSTTMAWKLRYKAAVGTARGLHYLHKGCQRRIIHRDIKSSNILLSANFEAQISDFGLAKWLPSEWTHRAVAPIEGTFGCLAPEYFTHGIVDEKTDVFAFGVFILEMISGRKPVDGSHNSLLSCAKPFLNDGTIHLLVDTRLEENYDIDQLKRLAFIASLCIRASATCRPSMAEVLNLIEGGDMSSERWRMPEEEEEFWDLDDLEDCDASTSSSSSSLLSSSSSLSMGG